MPRKLATLTLHLDQAILDEYDECRAVARRLGSTLNASWDTTSIVNGAYVRLRQGSVAFESETHFLRAAARTIRHLLIDRHRNQVVRSRAENSLRFGLTRGVVVNYEQEDVLDLHQALLELEEVDSRKSTLVELRFFGGCTLEQSAKVLGISTTRAHQEWTMARAWLHRRLRD